MKKSVLSLSSGICLLFMASCGHESADEKPGTQYDKVGQYLDTGGVFYAYIDIQGELQNLAEALDRGVKAYLEENPLPLEFPTNVTMAFKNLGILDFSAMGYSSRRLDNGLFHNRSILYFTEAPSGLFQWMGDESTDFLSWQYAPASADLVMEINYRPALWRDTILDVIQSIAGSMGRGLVAMQLQQKAPMLEDMTYNNLLESIGSRMILCIAFQQDETLKLEEGIEIPKVEFFIVLEQLGDLMEKLSANLRGLPGVEWKETDYGFLLRLENPASYPFDYLTPEIRVNRENGLVWLSSSPEFLNESMSQNKLLRNTAGFATAMEELPTKGTSFFYVSAHAQELFEELIMKAVSQNPEIAFFAGWLKSIFPEQYHSMAAVTEIRPDGIYTASNWSSSYRSKMAAMSLQPMLLLAGIGSATAIPAFENVRSTSQEKTVLNNLRMIASAGQQYLLENGVESVKYDDLVGDYFHPVQPVLGEDYSQLTVRFRGTLSVELHDGRIVEYQY